MRRAQKVDLWAHQSVALNYKKSGVGFTKSASDFPAGALIRVDRCLMKGSDTENVLHVLLQMHPHAHQDVDNLVRLLTRAISVCSALRPMIDSGVHPPPSPTRTHAKNPRAQQTPARVQPEAIPSRKSCNSERARTTTRDASFRTEADVSRLPKPRLPSTPNFIMATYDYEQVKSGLADNSIVLIDVRKADERKKERIPGSVHLPGDSKVSNHRATRNFTSTN